MSWTLFGQTCAFAVIAWIFIPTIHASILDKRYADALRRKQSGVNL